MRPVLRVKETDAVSILNRLSAARHLDDGTLAEIWTEATTSGQPVSHAHLSMCAQCRSRYAAFTGWLDRVRTDATTEADEAFPPERLASQQAHIFRRLEALERPARVIAFPRFHRPVTSGQGNAQRWVAAAAAAGLVIGLAAGQFVDIRHRFDANVAQNRQPQNTNARLNPVPDTTADNSAANGHPAVSDETLYFGADLVPISALQPMDSITPLARDYEQPQ
jgi:hypothetical protein